VPEPRTSEPSITGSLSVIVTATLVETLIAVAIRLDPQNATAYCNRGFAYIKKKQYDSAIVDLAQNALHGCSRSRTRNSALAITSTLGLSRISFSKPSP